MVSFAQLGLRVAQFVFILIATALVGNAIAIQSYSNSSVNYAIFACVWAWLAILVGLAASFVESLAIPIVLAVFDGLAVLFTFIAGVVLAAKLHVHSCSNRGYLLTNSLTQGSSHRCRDLQAATAFFWFAFAAFIGSLIVDFMGSKGGMSGRPGVRKGPNMAQV